MTRNRKKVVREKKGNAVTKKVFMWAIIVTILVMALTYAVNSL